MTIYYSHLHLLLLIIIIFNFQSGLQSGSLLKFAIGNGGLSFVDGKLEKSDLNYLGKSNRARMFADSYSKVRRKHLLYRLF